MSERAGRVLTWGNCAAAVIVPVGPAAPALAPPPVAASLERIDLSDIWRRWATGWIRARAAGSLDTSDFMSDSNSSN